MTDKLEKVLQLALEAYGINVYQAALDAGLRYINGPDTVTYFGTVLPKESQNA